MGNLSERPAINSAILRLAQPSDSVLYLVVLLPLPASFLREDRARQVDSRLRGNDENLRSIEVTYFSHAKTATRLLSPRAPAQSPFNSPSPSFFPRSGFEHLLNFHEYRSI